MVCHLENSCDQENLELQIRATQEERERIDTLLNEFLDTYTYYRKDRNINNRIDSLWKLAHDLLEAFEMDNAIDHDLFKKNSPPQLNQEGLMKINPIRNFFCFIYVFIYVLYMF